MLTSSSPKTLRLEEYRNLETSAETKHEYHDGEIIEKLYQNGRNIHDSIAIIRRDARINKFGAAL